MLGAWNVGVVVNSMPEKVATAFAEITGTLKGAQYTPIAYLGSRVVNGTNHAILCEQVLTTGRDDKNVVMMIINEKSEGFTLVSIDRVVEGTTGDGAVTVDVKTDIPTDAMVVFDEALVGFVGASVQPFALLGTQIVKGVDYIFACEVTLTTAVPVKKVSLVTVNALADKKVVSFENILG